MIRNVKQTAFDFVKANFGGVLLLFLPSLILSIIGGGVSYSIHGSDMAVNSGNFGNILTGLASIFSILASAAAYKALYQGQKDKLGLSGSFEGFLDVIGPLLILSILAGVVGIFVGILFGIVAVYGAFANPVFLFLVPVGLVALVYLAIRLSLADILIIDGRTNFSGRFPETMGVLDSVVFGVKESFRLTKGHTLDIFLLGLSLIGWIFLVLVTAGLAIFFVTPYFGVIQATLYKELSEA